MPINIGRHTYGTPIVKGQMNTVNIGSFCSIAENVVIDGGFNHNTSFISTFPFNQYWNLDLEGHPVCKGDVNIGNNVWIGQDVKIMSGVTIGDYSVIASGSIVTKDVTDFALYAGVPAKFVKRRFQIKDCCKLVEIKWWEWPDEEIKSIAHLLMSDKIHELYEYHLNRNK